MVWLERVADQHGRWAKRKNAAGECSRLAVISAGRRVLLEMWQESAVGDCDRSRAEEWGRESFAGECSRRTLQVCHTVW